MKAVFAANGSRGDVQPMLVLARAFKQRGHDVVLCATPGFSSWAQEAGIPFLPSGLDMEQFAQTHKDVHANPVKYIIRSWGLRHDEIRSQFEAVEQAAAGADLLVSAGTQLSGGSVAAHTGATHVAMFYVPTAMPSPSHAPFLVPWVDTPRWVNRLLWRCYVPVSMAMAGGPLNLQRKRLGLPPTRTLHAAYGPQHWMLAADPEVCPLPDDLRGRCTQTAAIVLAGDEDLPPDVDAFIRAGAAPVYLGFGSTADRDGPRTTRMLVEALQAAGVRALISKGTAGLGTGALPSSCMVVGSLPHHALFPRMAAIVHHGGAGTTAAAARSGVPQIVVPHVSDQFYFGNRILKMGLAPASIPRPKLTAAKLAAALQTAVTSEPMRQRARAAAEQLAARRGVDDSATFLERLMQQRAGKRGPLPLVG